MRIALFLLILVAVVPSVAVTATPIDRFYLVTELGNLFEVKPPLAAPKVVGQPYLDRQIAGGLMAYIGGDRRVIETGTLNDVGPSSGVPNEVAIIENWAQGEGPFPLHGDGPPNGEIWIDYVGERAFVGEMVPAADIPGIASFATWTPHNPATDIHHLPGVEVDVDSTNGYITFTGTGRVLINADHGHGYTAVNFICTYCEDETMAYMGSTSSLTLLGDFVAEYDTPGYEIRVDSGDFSRPPVNIPLSRIPEGVSHVAGQQIFDVPGLYQYITAEVTGDGMPIDIGPFSASSTTTILDGQRVVETIDFMASGAVDTLTLTLDVQPILSVADCSEFGGRMTIRLISPQGSDWYMPVPSCPPSAVQLDAYSDTFTITRFDDHQISGEWELEFNDRNIELGWTGVNTVTWTLEATSTTNTGSTTVTHESVERGLPIFPGVPSSDTIETPWVSGVYVDYVTIELDVNDILVPGSLQIDLIKETPGFTTTTTRLVSYGDTISDSYVVPFSGMPVNGEWRLEITNAGDLLAWLVYWDLDIVRDVGGIIPVTPFDSFPASDVIPNLGTGTNTIAVHDAGEILTFEVNTDITNFYTEQLDVTLTEPDGVTTHVLDKTGLPYYYGWRGATFTPPITGVDMAGDWILTVTDNNNVDNSALGDTTIDRWNITMTRDQFHSWDGNCPYPADHEDIEVDMDYDGTDLIIKAKNTIYNCYIEPLRLNLYTSRVSLQNPIPLRPGYNFYETHNTLDDVIIVNVDGWARMQIIRVDDVSGNLISGTLGTTAQCCFGFERNLSLHEYWPDRGIAFHTTPITDKMAILHDASAHYLAFDGTVLDPIPDSLEGIQDVAASTLPRPGHSAAAVSHSTDRRAPTYNGASNPVGGPYCAGPDSDAKYCVTVFGDTTSIDLSSIQKLYFNLPTSTIHNYELYDARNDQQLISTDTITHDNRGFVVGEQVHPKDDFLEMVDMYAVIPYSSATVVHEAYVTSDECNNYIDSGENWMADSATKMQTTRLHYLDNESPNPDNGNYGGDNDKTMDVPMISNRPYLCIHESNYHKKWRQIHMPSLPMDGGLGALLGDTRVLRSYTSPAGTTTPAVTIMNSETVYHTTIRMPRDAHVTADIRYEMGMAISAFGNSRPSTINNDVSTWRDDDTDAELVLDMAIRGNDGNHIPGSPFRLIEFNGKMWELHGEGPLGSEPVPPNADGTHTCYARLYGYTDHVTDIVTKSFNAAENDAITIELVATAKMSNGGPTPLCGDAAPFERFFGEVDIRQLTIRLQ